MNGTAVERRLRLTCRALALVMSVGALVELWLVEHTGSVVQLIPFGLCALVAGSVIAVSIRTTPGAVRIHRVIMVGVMVGGAYGMYAHLSDNLTFAREIRPVAPTAEIWLAGLRGANPLLAGGVLVIAAALGTAGTHGARTDAADPA
jgi:hypothetical protein